MPRSIDDPDFPNAVYSAGRAHGWRLRELCMTRTLFESGARISEILDLTASYSAISEFTHRFTARNKGSHRQRVKTLVIAKPTATLFRKYLDHAKDGRAAWAHDGLRLRDLEPGKEPVPLWFIDLYDPHVFSHTYHPEAVAARATLSRHYGYSTTGIWTGKSRMLSTPPSFHGRIVFLRRRDRPAFLPPRRRLHGSDFRQYARQNPDVHGGTSRRGPADRSKWRVHQGTPERRTKGCNAMTAPPHA